MGLRRTIVGGLVGLAAVAVASCRSPNQVTINLRKEKQSLETEIDQLKADREVDRARIRGLEQRIGTVPTLPQSRLNQMFTVHSIKLGQLTGGANLDPAKPGDEGVRVDLIPLDDNGDPIKATGHVTVEVFDLHDNQPRSIGKWEFSAAQMKETWRSLGPIHEFVLDCPWQKIIPHDAKLVLKVKFIDELTQRIFEKVEQITINPPPVTTRPTTR